MKAPRLIIGRRLLSKVVALAREAGPNECIGLLASRGPSGPVIGGCVLPSQDATPCQAEAEPVAIRAAVSDLLGRGLVPAGLWHSHGNSEVHHSFVDDETTRRFLPAMAERLFRRPRTAPLVPIVVSRDEAELPLRDGTYLRFALLGPAIPGSDARTRIAWTSTTIRMAARRSQPRAIRSPDRLRLVGGPVVLDLGLPEGHVLESRVVDRSPLRVARMWSLVVNTAGETHAEMLTLLDIQGRSVVQQRPCSIEVVGKGATRAAARGGRSS